jgi:glutathione synthase
MIKLGIVMDPISSINIKKDTSFAMLLEAQRRGWELHYMEMTIPCICMPRSTAAPALGC